MGFLLKLINKQYYLSAILTSLDRLQFQRIISLLVQGLFSTIGNNNKNLVSSVAAWNNTYYYLYW